MWLSELNIPALLVNSYNLLSGPHFDEFLSLILSIQELAELHGFYVVYGQDGNFSPVNKNHKNYSNGKKFVAAAAEVGIHFLQNFDFPTTKATNKTTPNVISHLYTSIPLQYIESNYNLPH